MNGDKSYCGRCGGPHRGMLFDGGYALVDIRSGTHLWFETDSSTPKDYSSDPAALQVRIAEKMESFRRAHS